VERYTVVRTAYRAAIALIVHSEDTRRIILQGDFSETKHTQIRTGCRDLSLRQDGRANCSHQDVALIVRYAQRAVRHDGGARAGAADAGRPAIYRSRPGKINKTSELRILALERVMGIEPALSAWEAVPSGPFTRPDLRTGLSASNRERPLVTGVNGPLMARRTVARAALMAVP
jgi:hypothetical protein